MFRYKCAKFHAKGLTQSEIIVKSFREGYIILTHPMSSAE